MESQPQNPEFRNNPENFHSCTCQNAILLEITCHSSFLFQLDDEEELTQTKASKSRLEDLTHVDDPIEEGTANGTSIVDYQNPAYDDKTQILE